MNSPATPPGQADMEEILSSIRSSLEEETGRVAKEQGMAAALVEAPLEDDDVLELDAGDMLEEAEPAAPEAPMVVAADLTDIPHVDEIFDINAFATEGKEQKLGADKVKELAAGLGEDDLIEPVDVTQAEMAAETAAPVPAQEQAAADDFDRLLNELQTETASVAEAAPVVETPVVAEVTPAEEEIDIDAMMAAAPAAEASAPIADITETFVETVVQDVMPVVAAGTTRRVQLAAIPGVSGLQVALPAEILAEALRPLVKDWVAENLAQVVERLVADEIEKLVKD